MLTLATVLVLAAGSGPAISSAAPTAGLERAKNTVLVLMLRAIGVTDDEATAATAQVTEALSGRTDLRVVSAQDVNELVEHQKTLGRMACDDDACIAEMSKVANAELVLSGSLGKIGSELVIALHLIDVEKNAPVGGASWTVSSLGALGDALPEILAEVFGTEGASPRARFSLPAGQETSFAVFDLKPLGIEQEAADNLTQVLAAELKQIEGASVISRDDIASMLELEAERNRLDCEDATECLAEVGGALGVDKLVVGHAGKLGETFVVSLRLIDTTSVAVDSRVTESFKGLEDQLIYAVRFAGRGLLGIEAKTPGKLALSGSQPEARVFLDAEEVGALPLPPRDGLAPGRHSMRVAREGFFDWRSDFYVEPAGTTALWAELKEEPAKWYEKWWVWTIAGAVVVGASSAAIYFGTQGGSGDGKVNSGTTDAVVNFSEVL